MGMFLPRPRRHSAGPHRAPARAAEAPPPTTGCTDEVAARAEDVVRKMWLRTLRSDCENTEAAVKAASARCEVARRDLVAVLLGRAPGDSTAAGADLERRLIEARATIRAHNQACEALAAELGLWEDRGTDRFLDEYLNRGGTSAGRSGSASTRWPNRLVRALFSLGLLTRHAWSWVVRLAAILTRSLKH